jgi:ribosome-binding factor A
MEFDFTLPGLGKPQSSRPQRVAEAIKNEMSVLLQREVADPRLDAISFTQVLMTPDLNLAKVYFVLPVGGDAKQALKGLKKAKGFFRSRLAKAMNLRHTPDLVFYYDHDGEKVDRIEELLMEIEEERKDSDK